MLLRGIAHEGVHSFAHAYQRAPFVGRARALALLRQFLDDSSAHGLLCAPAGRGKSALLCHLAHALDASGHRVVWLPISLRYGTHRSATLDEILTARLRALLARPGHWRDLLTGYEGPALLLVLDGLDELQDHALLGALAGLTLPPAVKVLAAARTLLDRDAAGWAAHLRWQPCALLDLDPLSLDEVTEFLRSDPSAPSAGELMGRTGGEPLLLRICLEAMARGEPLPDTSDPTELVGAWWDEQRARLQGPRGEAAGRLLATLGAACGPVPWWVLARVADVDEATAREALRGFERFVLEEAEGVTFAHPRFAEVARWTFVDATQRALQRFAALAREARQGDDPPSYFLHFALPHLEAAGASEEDLVGLLGEGSLAAWQRAEGSAHGFLHEVRALQRRLPGLLARTWGTDAFLAALQLQARANVLGATVQGSLRELEPAFLTELVRHGLRSSSQALQVVSELPEDRRQGALQELLPVLPDRALPAAVAVLPQGGSYPHGPLVQRLLQADLWAEAQAYLDGFASLPTHALVGMMPLLSLAQVERLRRLVEARIAKDATYPTLTQRLIRLPLLSPDEQAEELDRCEQVLIELQRTPTARENDRYEVASSCILIEEAVRLGQGERALRWLRRSLARDEDSRREHPDRTGHRLSLFIHLWKNMEMPEQEEARGLIAEVMRRYPPSAEGGRHQATRAPADFPGCDALLEGLWTHLAVDPLKRGRYLLQDPGLPPWLCARAEEAIFAHLDQLFARHLTLTRREQRTDRDWYSALSSLRYLTLPSPEPLFSRLPRWFTSPSPADALCSAMLRHATTEESRAQVRQWLVDGTVKAGKWLWSHENWLQIVPDAERLALLSEHLRQPPDVSRALDLVVRSLSLLEPAHDSAVMDTLLPALARADPPRTLLLPLVSPVVQALLSSEDHQELLDLAVRELVPGASGVALRRFDSLLHPRAGRGSTLPLARAILQQLERSPLPCFPVELTALSLVPADEARAWVERCCTLPEAAATDLESWSRSTARWRPEDLAALTPEPAQSWDPLSLDLGPPPWNAWRAQHVSRRVERIPPAFLPQFLPCSEQELGASFAGLRDLDTAAVLAIAPHLLESGLDEMSRDLLVERVAGSLLRGSPEQERLEALLRRLAPPRDPPGPPERCSGGAGLAWLWWSRALPLDLRLRALVEREPILGASLVSIARGAGIHEPMALSLLGSRMEACDRLMVWSHLWEELSETTRAALRAPNEEAVRLVQREERRDRAGAWVLSWGLARLEPEAQREVWLDESGRPRREVMFPVEALRQIGGDAAVAEWARGVSQAVGLLTSGGSG